MSIKQAILGGKGFLIAAGITFVVLADIAFSYGAVHGQSAGPYVNLFWLGGYLLIGVTSVYEIETHPRYEKEEGARLAA